MTNTEGLNHLLNLALTGPTSYHPGYEWTVKYADDLKAHFGDVDIEKYRKIFSRRVSPELFKQAGEITNPVQGSIGNMLDKPFAKIERSNYIEYVTVGGDESGKKATEFKKEVIDKFGPKGLFPYTFERLRYWNTFDPNCFVAVEIQPFDNNKTKAKPYPFEVTSDMAVDFKYNQSDLVYLCCLQIQTKKDSHGPAKVKRLTMFQAKQNLVLQQLTPDEIKALPTKPLNEQPFEGEVIDGDMVMFNNDIYKAEIPIPNNSEKNPAVRCGFIDNPIDDGATKLSIFYAGLPFARKMLKINEELDLVAALLANPIPFRAKDPCGAKGCIKGKMITDDSDCEVCHGTGYKLRPTTSAEELEIPFPDTPSEMYDPAKLIGYIHFPVENAEMLLTLWDKWMDKAILSVFNSELTTKSEVAQTARFHSKAEQGINDTLWPYGVHISSVCAYISSICGDFTFYPEAIAKPIIPANLRFDTVYDVLDKLKAARDAGAGIDACAELQAQAMEIILQDNPEALKRWKVDDSFDPFRGMTEEQIIFSLNSTHVPEAKKVYFQNQSEIKEEILSENPKFYNMPRKAQKDLIDTKVKAIQDSIAASTPTLNIPAFNQNLSGN